MLADESFDQLELRAVGVLVLVDLHMVEPLLMPLQDLGEVVEQLIGQQQQIVEVDAPGRFQLGLIFAIGHRGEELFVVLSCVLGAVGADANRLPLADNREQVAGPQ